MIYGIPYETLEYLVKANISRVDFDTNVTVIIWRNPYQAERYGSLNIQCLNTSFVELSFSEVFEKAAIEKRNREFGTKLTQLLK